MTRADNSTQAKTTQSSPKSNLSKLPETLIKTAQQLQTYKHGISANRFEH